MVLGGPMTTISALAFLWLVAGGLFYTTGLAFFIRDDRPYNHAIWHLFVMAGSACHYRVVFEHLVCLPA